jgi:Zn-dependent protease with chaperone function
MVSGVVLVWLFGSRYDPPLTVFEACLMMMRQVWGLTQQPVLSPPIAGYVVLGLAISGLWAGGRGLTAWWRTRRLLSRSALYRPGRWPALDAALRTLPHIQRRLRTLAAVPPVACTVGLWRPQIVLSVGLLAELSPAELCAVLGHEWGHVRCRDPLRLALLRFCGAALWFVPIVRALAHDSALAMEDAADDVAVALTDQPLELAAALVKTARAQASRRSVPVPALGGEQVITARVERLLAVTPPQPPQRHVRTWVGSVLIATALSAVLLLSRQPVVAATPAALGTSEPLLTCPMRTPQGS